MLLAGGSIHRRGYTIVIKTFLLVFALVLGGILMATIATFSSYALQDGYYQELYQDDPQFPEDNQPLEEQGYDEYGDQNPDPEFMEQVEPGEYDQSDDTTILDDGDY